MTCLYIQIFVQIVIHTKVVLQRLYTCMCIVRKKNDKFITRHLGYLDVSFVLHILTIVGTKYSELT